MYGSMGDRGQRGPDPQRADERVGEDDRLGSCCQEEGCDLAPAVIPQQLRQLGQEEGYL